jgi:hypothetical protein
MDAPAHTRTEGVGRDDVGWRPRRDAHGDRVITPLGDYDLVAD